MEEIKGESSGSKSLTGSGSGNKTSNGSEPQDELDDDDYIQEASVSSGLINSII